MENTDIAQLTTRIVSAFVGHNAVGMHDLPTVIGSVQRTLMQIARPSAAAPAPGAAGAPGGLKPAVPIKRSVTQDAIICLECGRSQKTLRRHLGAEHSLTPLEYRQRWGLPPEYPMSSPAYTAKRSEFAKKSGLGKSRRY